MFDNHDSGLSSLRVPGMVQRYPEELQKVLIYKVLIYVNYYGIQSVPTKNIGSYIL